MQITSWENKRIIITGSSGFIGSRLSLYFRKRNATVLGLSRGNPPKEGATNVDVSNYTKFSAVVKKFKPDAVFHLASVAFVEVGQAKPYETFRNNILSTLSVLEACRMFRVPRIIIASTVHVYGHGPKPYNEDEPARPSRPYETSKTSGDLIAQSYADSYNLPVLIPRFVNIYGPGDTSSSRIIPKTIQAIMQNKEPTLWGGHVTRDYLYIDDALLAYDLLGKISDARMGKNRIFNFATGNLVTAKKLIEMIISLTGKQITIKKITGVRTNELEGQDVNWSKAMEIVGWRPATDIRTGLAKTIEWFQARN